MMTKSALKIFGLDFVWKDKNFASVKLIVVCPNISKDGSILMEKMLFSIGFYLKNENVLVIKSGLKNYRKNEFVLSFVNNENHDNVFCCEHPDAILNNYILKRKAWITLCDLKKAIEIHEKQNIH